MIIYFTGSGNSRAVATQLSRLLGDNDVIDLRGATLIDCHIAESVKERVVWVFPVYSWGIPPVVVDFIKKVALRGADQAIHHMVATCGDDAGLTSQQWRRLIAERGWQSASASTVIMPNTYTLMKGFDVDPREVAEGKLQQAAARVEEIAQRIISNIIDDDVIKGRYAWFKSRIIYPGFKRFAMSPKPFHATDDCIKCKLCIRECPLANITLQATNSASTSSPYAQQSAATICEATNDSGVSSQSDNGSKAFTLQWGNRCALCLRCYHICPRGAVQYGSATQSKGRYLHPGSPIKS